ncbi:MAG: hypothetical protein HY903_20900 [Deltaproteobacteria bacterium]|nr:hypothetical protein [Deltaproteobacteria bacterium]
MTPSLQVAAALTLAVGIGAGPACNEQRPPAAHHPPELTSPLWAHDLLPSERYLFTFAKPPDSWPVCTLWSGDALAGSPWAVMERLPLILKADDFGSALNIEGTRFLTAVTRRQGVAALGIVTASLPETPAVLDTYRRLAAAGFELWFHGHTHAMDKGRTEFFGASLDDQRRSFVAGTRRGALRLGVTFETFGAPGNMLDDNTREAIRAAPALALWLFGPPAAPILTLPRQADVETRPGLIGAPETGLAAIELAIRQGARVLVLQVHPRSHDDGSAARLEEILDRLQQAHPYYLTTPTAWRRFQENAARVRVTKLADTQYLVDLSLAAAPLYLALDPDGPLPIGVEPTAIDAAACAATPAP